MKPLSTDNLKPQRLLNNKGQILIVVGLFSVILLAAAGLAIDVSSVALQKAELRHAADAGVIAGVMALPDVSTTQGGLEKAEKIAGEIAKLNADKSGLTNASFITAINIVTTVDDQYIQLTINATAKAPTIFMRLLDIHEVSIAASPEARRSRAVVSLVLDTSGSMTGKKIANLKIGAKEFVSHFVPTWDYMAITIFNDHASVIFPMKEIAAGNGPGSIQAMQTLIDGLSADGSTNFGEAMATGYGEIVTAVQNNSQLSNATRAIVLFSDGLPTKGCKSCFYTTADTARSKGVWIFTIGTPDAGEKLMKTLANDGGIVNKSQPQGLYLESPDTSNLVILFRKVARYLSARLVR